MGRDVSNMVMVWNDSRYIESVRIRMARIKFNPEIKWRKV